MTIALVLVVFSLVGGLDGLAGGGLLTVVLIAALALRFTGVRISISQEQVDVVNPRKSGPDPWAFHFQRTEVASVRIDPHQVTVVDRRGNRLAEVAPIYTPQQLAKIASVLSVRLIDRRGKGRH
jgi:hypothetical protein